MTRGFVDVQVDADHEFQAFQRLLQLTPVGRRQHRITRNGDQRLDLPFAVGQHFLGQRRNRQLAAVLRQPGDATLPPIEVPPDVDATRSSAGSVHSAPPTRSRLPVTRLINCTSQWHRVPNAWVETPMRP